MLLIAKGILVFSFNNVSIINIYVNRCRQKVFETVKNVRK